MAGCCAPMAPGPRLRPGNGPHRLGSTLRALDGRPVRSGPAWPAVGCRRQRQDRQVHRCGRARRGPARFERTCLLPSRALFASLRAPHGDPVGPFALSSRAQRPRFLASPGIWRLAWSGRSRGAPGPRKLPRRDRGRAGGRRPVVAGVPGEDVRWFGFLWDPRGSLYSGRRSPLCRRAAATRVLGRLVSGSGKWLVRSRRGDVSRHVGVGRRSQCPPRAPSPRA
jgi:hypothetical protein